MDMTNATNISTRKKLSAAQREDHIKNGAIVADDRRRRPLWFDGRFLDAAALTSEQQYFLSRQADIARVAGVGVVNGLMVEPIEDKSRSIRIRAGHGITPAGGLVVLQEDLEVDLANVAESQKLDASFGLSKIPRQPFRNRSGLFIVALRPVEYSAEPIASYPTSIKGSRSVEDGSIIEATAVTLIPYPDQGPRTEVKNRRNHVAYEIFVNGSKKGQPTGVLPLALVALNLGFIEWVDPYLVRREVGASEHDIFGLGISPRTLREAFLLQYQHHLENVREEGRFQASEHFRALPSAGPMPPASIDLDNFTQLYFPAEMKVDLSFIPEDELPSLLEESFSLPPIDLTLSGDEYDSTSILVMIPVARHRVRKLSLSLKSVLFPLKPITIGLHTKRTPLSTLTNLTAIRTPATPGMAINSSEEVWREALSSADTLWYARRRNINYKPEVVSPPIVAIRDETEVETAVADRAKVSGFEAIFKNVIKNGTIAARADVHTLLSARKFRVGPKILLGGAIHELNAFDKVKRSSVLKVSQRFSESQFGEGVSRLVDINSVFLKDEVIVEAVSTSGKVPELDWVARALPKEKLVPFSKELQKVAKEDGKAQPKKVANLVANKIKELEAPKRIL